MLGNFDFVRVTSIRIGHKSPTRHTLRAEKCVRVYVCTRNARSVYPLGKVGRHIHYSLL